MQQCKELDMVSAVQIKLVTLNTDGDDDNDNDKQLQCSMSSYENSLLMSTFPVIH